MPDTGCEVILLPQTGLFLTGVFVMAESKRYLEEFKLRAAALVASWRLLLIGLVNTLNLQDYRCDVLS